MQQVKDTFSEVSWVLSVQTSHLIKACYCEKTAKCFPCSMNHHLAEMTNPEELREGRGGMSEACFLEDGLAWPRQ